MLRYVQRDCLRERMVYGFVGPGVTVNFCGSPLDSYGSINILLVTVRSAKNDTAHTIRQRCSSGCRVRS